jgi:hypothetical protein
MAYILLGVTQAGAASSAPTGETSPDINAASFYLSGRYFSSSPNLRLTIWLLYFRAKYHTISNWPAMAG